MGLRSQGSTSRLINTTWPLTPTSHLMQQTVTATFYLSWNTQKIYEDKWSKGQHCSKKKKKKRFKYNNRGIYTSVQQNGSLTLRIKIVLWFNIRIYSMHTCIQITGLRSHCAEILDPQSKWQRAQNDGVITKWWTQVMRITGVTIARREVKLSDGPPALESLKSYFMKSAQNKTTIRPFFSSLANKSLISDNWDSNCWTSEWILTRKNVEFMFARHVWMLHDF